MLWVAAAVAAPVIIHLVMRTRPREVVFPAMRFVLKSHMANRARLKLKHLILLAMRMLAVLLLVGLLAGPKWVSAGGGGGVEPLAVVVAIDNSGSMGYRFAGQTHLAAGKALARRFVEQLPPGSRVGVLYGANGSSATDASAALHIDRALAQRLIAEAPPSAEPVAVGPLLEQATALLEGSPLKRRAVLLLNDRTAVGWQGVRTGPLGRADGVEVLLADCWRGEDVNFSLGDVRLEHELTPVGAAGFVRTTVRCGRSGGELGVGLRLNGQPAGRAAVTLRRAFDEAVVEFAAVADAAGLIEGEIVLEADDPLAMDNVRYFTLTAEPPETMLVVRDPASVGREELTGFLLSSAVAPAGRLGGQLVRPRALSADDLGAAVLAEAAIVLLANVSALSEAQWSLLGDYVRDGGRLWVIPGDLTGAAGLSAPAAQAVLPVRAGGVEMLDPPARFSSAGLAGPYVQPFVGDENPPLSQVEIYRRFGVEALASGATTELAFDDGRPAIASRTLGRGRVLWWSFSPAEQWSDLRMRAQFPILASRAAMVLLGADRQPMNYVLGQSVALAVPPELLGTPAVVQPPGGPERPVAVDRRTGQIALRPNQAGHWRVRLAPGSAEQTLGFAVSAPAAESDLTLLSAEQIADLLAPLPVTVAATAEQIKPVAEAETTAHDLLPPLALLAAGLLIAESFLANRFYRRAADAVEP